MGLRCVLLLFIFVTASLGATGRGRLSPIPVTWERLRDVQFKKRWYVEESRSAGAVLMLVPSFGPSVKALRNKAVTISGYVIPLDLENGLYVVSQYPMAQCFFCGAAGPESVMALKFRTLSRRGFARRFKTDERRTFSGTLRLNADIMYELNYILDGAELLPDAPR